MRFEWGTAFRELIVAASCVLPRHRNIRLERWLRGRQEHAKLTSADFVIVSFPNSGRTWLHVLLLRYFQEARGYHDARFADLGALRDLDPAVPLIHFSHDNYLRDYTGEGALKAAYRQKKVVLLVRDPADVAVSQFHQWRHRMRRRKKVINAYPLDVQLPLFEFTMGKNGALARAIRFLNEWAAALPTMPNILLIRYEDLVADAEAELTKILSFLGERPPVARIREAIEFASVANMRRLESRGGRLFRPGKWRLGGTQVEGQFKARRAKVGGYRADFSAYEVSLIDAAIDGTLSPIFGYQRGGSAAAEVSVSKSRIRAATTENSAELGTTV